MPPLAFVAPTAGLDSVSHRHPHAERHRAVVVPSGLAITTVMLGLIVMIGVVGTTGIT